MSSAWDCVTAFLSADSFRGFVLLLGVLVAVVSVHTSRVLARKKQTADLMFATRNDTMLHNGLVCVSQLHEAKDTNIRALAGKDQLTTDNSKSIRYVLNHFESVSVCIQAGIYDEDMIKASLYNTIIHLNKCVTPFIDKAREDTGRKTLYQEFRWLAQRWEKQPLKTKS